MNIRCLLPFFSILKLSIVTLFMSQFTIRIQFIIVVRVYSLQAVETSLQSLKQSNTDTFYRQHSWSLIKCFLVSAVNLDDDKVTLTHLLLHHNFQDGPIQNLNVHSIYECADTHVRGVMKKALSAMFGMQVLRLCSFVFYCTF